MSERRVLIIEDDLDVLEITRLSLELVAGWSVTAVDSGREGALAAERQPPDVVLLDVMMPDMDGFDTLRDIRSRSACREVPVILLSARLRPGDRERFAALGIAGTIAKPYDPVRLADQVAGLLGWN